MQYRDFTTTGEVLQDIDLESFIKLYINHRPTAPLDRTDIEKVRRGDRRRKDSRLLR